MADVELVIKIPEETYNFLKKYGTYGGICENAILNGTPLPKGHGRLIEVNENLYQEIRKWIGVGMASKLLDDAPTIIEADKEE